jgi:hypothetical protein
MELAYVNQPVVNLRAIPTAHNQKYIKDLEQESQLLFGDWVRCLKAQGEWVYVEALEQKTFRNGKWIYYPGWVPKKSLEKLNQRYEKNCIVHDDSFFGSCFAGKTQSSTIFFKTPSFKLPLNKVYFFKDIHKWREEDKRKVLLSHCEKFLGMPYLWGGNSLYVKKASYEITSVDCSGLVYLLYRMLGIQVPRNAHDQFLLAKETIQIKPGDLLFYRENQEQPQHVTHVMIFKDQETLIEAVASAQCVREISLKERFSLSLNEILSDKSALLSAGTFF